MAICGAYMAHIRPDLTRNRNYILPLVVALPIFFCLFALMEGWFLIAWIENGWDSGRGNVWQAIQAAQKFLWVFAAVGIGVGIAWAWVILLPVKRYQIQLNRLIEQGKSEPLEVDHQSEFSGLAQTFNMLLEEMGKHLPPRTQALLDTLSSGVVLFNSAGEVDWANPMASRLFELSPDRLRGKKVEEIFTRSPALEASVRKALELQSDFPQESVRFTDRFGEVRPVGVRLAWVRDGDGKPVSLVLTVQDLTRLEAITAGLKTAERMSSLVTIAAGIAHEVRNPLASIRGLAQLLNSSDKVTSEKVGSYTKVILGEVDRVNRVIDRLSLLASTQEEEPTRTEIGQVINSAIEMASHGARKRHVEIIQETGQPELAYELRVQHFTQAIMNVLINGIEAAPEGGRVWITGRGEAEGGYTIEIENEGASIPPGELDNLFLPFHTTKDQRTGLGLTITDSIVRDHGGTVEVHSGTNRTVFTIQIPAQTAETGSPPPSGQIHEVQADPQGEG